jgi:4,5-dihydroxyphthalate decarboxylase
MFSAFLTNLKLRIACPEYDKTAPLLNGEVKGDGIEFSFLPVRPAEAHRMMLEGRKDIDVSEMSISYYLISKSMGKANFTAIPVFPMRSFFHTQLLCNADSAIESPSSIKGKRIGVQEYGMSIALWIRGILQHEFGVLPSDLEWFLERKPGQTVGDALGFIPPSNVKITHLAQTGNDLMTMLQNGEIDVAYPYPSVWRTRLDEARSQRERNDKVRTLFQNPKEESIRYFRKTGIFPINHLIVIRDEILAREPWVAGSLYRSFEESKSLSYEKAAKMAEKPNNFVWLDSLLDEVREIFGEDPFPYGIKRNTNVLEAVTRFSHEQGLSIKKLEVSALFAPGAF